MPLFAVSLLSRCHVAGVLQPEPLREVAIHIVEALDEHGARSRGTELGIGRQHTYRNAAGEAVSWVFQRVVECQELPARELTDGMEVSSWLYGGKRLCLDDGWSDPCDEPS